MVSYPFLTVEASAAALALAYDFPKYGWPIILIGLIPLFALIKSRSFSAKKIFSLGYLFGSVYIGITTIWLLQSFPLDWANISSPVTSSFLVIITWLIIALTLGLFTGLWALTFRKLKNGNPLTDALLAASLWIILEYFRTFAFSLVWSGPDSAIGAHFAIGVLGHVLAWSPILPIASIGGSYFLSFFIVIVNALLFSSVENFDSARIRSQFENLSSRSSFPITIIIVLLISSFLWHSILSQENHPFSGQNRGNISIALVHTNFSERSSENPHFEEAKFTAINQLLSQVKNDEKHPELLILPEDARFLTSLAPESRRPFFSDMLGDGEKTAIDSAHAISHGRIVPTASFYNTKTDTLATSEKQVLIPNGEYLPWITVFSLEIAGMKNVIRDFLATRGFERGDTAASVQHGPFRISTLLCSEIFSPSLLHEMPFDRSDIIINLSSHAIFHGSALLENQTVALAKIRAVEIGIPVIVAGNMTPSLTIDPQGTLIAFNDSLAPSVTYISLPISNETTPYREYGDWLLVLSALFILFQASFPHILTKRKNT